VLHECAKPGGAVGSSSVPVKETSTPSRVGWT
jgi:hypothetical protein